MFKRLLKNSFACQRCFLTQRMFCGKKVSPQMTPNFNEPLPSMLNETASVSTEAQSRKNVGLDPEDSNILLFPGQGTQRVGMLNKEMLKNKTILEMFDCASHILGYDLKKLCRNGPQSQLDKTRFAQPAILVTSLAGVEELSLRRPDVLDQCRGAAGYSVGEYAALVFAGAITFEDAVTLIKIRAEGMQMASERVPSQMITCLGKSSTKFKHACQEARQHCSEQLHMEDPTCHIAAWIAPNLVTIGGNTEAIDWIRGNAAKLNIRKIMPIPVSGAFHTRLMEPAVQNLKTALTHTQIEQPLVSVYSNLTGRRYRSPGDIRTGLIRQLVNPVMWEQLVGTMVGRSRETPMPAFYEVGPGEQLGSLLKRCNGKAAKNYTSVDRMFLSDYYN